MCESIYGKYREVLEQIMSSFVANLHQYNKKVYEETGYKLFEHLNSRIKEEESIRENAGERICRRIPIVPWLN